MDKITKIPASQLSEFMTTGSQLQRRLSKEDGLRLTTLVDKMLHRWPHQDQGETIEEFLEDFEHLALKYSLQKVEEAITALRIDPKQKFFPRPDEVAEEMEVQRNRRAHEIYLKEKAKEREERQRKIAEVLAERETPEWKEWAKGRGII